ncbi:MAG: aminotransferase class I/II-fold pyridoxal phosphate-dependent enzyme [Clostridiales Family XIII bacterium]|jgi:methionine-gamma-lyase|nr:aminotransferase class I/II-fold pyridoxal phosphate-dependent enzyme [Clostridiales Family XIII bacterium]
MGKGLSTTLLRGGDGQYAKKLAKTASIAETFPIYHTSVFSFEDIAAVDAIYEKQASGYIYSRIAAPNADAVSEALAAADGAEAALVFASGMAAITTAILSLVGNGDHVIVSNVLYGGVQDFFANELPRLGVEVTFLDLNAEEVAPHIKGNTKFIYSEVISNPLMEVPDIEALSKAAHEAGALLVLDGTFATPVVVRPLALGADVVLYSATKYLGGHSDLVGGAVVGSAHIIERIRRFQVLYGGIISPQDAWLLARSLRTLDLRVRKHSENALAVARFLESSPQVEKVFYPGLESSPSHARAKRQFAEGLYGGMLSVDLKGGEEAALKLLGALDRITIVPSLAGTQTTVSWSARTSHRFYKREDRLKAGITDGQLRFSVGLEDEGDIIAELSAALEALGP